MQIINMDNKAINNFKKELNEYGYNLDEQTFDKFIKYYELLISWNEKMNLTAITEFDDVLKKHFLDSLSIIKIIDLNNVNSLIDIGTGAGFPGIPIKIMYPELEVTLLDSLQKRIGFLDTVISELKLEKITTIHGRAEDFAKPDKLREQFDVCVSRAVSNLSSLSELCLPFVKVGGCFIPYKSEKTNDELANAKNALDILGGSCENVVSFNIDNNERTLLLLRKKNSTPKKYPRKAGTPVKDPL